MRIQNLAECIGVLVAACPGVAYGWLYYKELELVKRCALTLNHNNTKEFTNLSEGALDELKWWDSEILSVKNKIRSSNYDLEIFSDASTTGWGATCGTREAHGWWTAAERQMHINYLEIKAAFFALKCFASSISDKQILLRIDNITALAYLNKMGGIKHRDLNNITKETWEWCRSRQIWIFAEYVASKENPADKGSRITNPDTEWELANFAFRELIQKFGNPTIDLFASRTNRKCDRYCSWDRDPEALSINSLTINWKGEFWYAFPPFSLIARLLKKVREEGSTGILVVPYWTGQPWFPEFKRLLISNLIHWQPSNNLLLSPCRKMVHPMASSLTLVSGIVSGKHCFLRSAIASINSFDTSESPLITRFFKGVFRLRPTISKYNSTWDTDIMLRKLKGWSPIEILDLQKLTIKTVMLVALGSAFRAQSLALMQMKDITAHSGGVEVRITNLIKTSRAGINQPRVFFPFFNDKDLCVAHTLLFYIEATNSIRGEKERLFLSFKKPYGEICSQTISRWLKLAMKEAGVDDKYKAHSTRHASSSKAAIKGVELKVIKDAAGWSERSSTFFKFYKKPIDSSEGRFAKAVLSQD